MKRILVVAALLLAAQAGRAESQRSLFTHENKLPDYHKAEVGALFEAVQYEAVDLTTLAPYARFSVLTDLVVNVSVPYTETDPQLGRGSSEQGFGDVRVGVELRAFEDIFGYPYCIPHADAQLSTGDEDKGLGRGDTVATLGVSVGTVTFDVLHWVADLSFAINGGRGEDEDNVVIVGGALIWDVSKKFDVLGEFKITNEDTADDNTPVILQAGMNYKFTPRFTLGWYGGLGGGNAEEPESLAAVKAAYTF